jgi:hypothetical protein
VMERLAAPREQGGDGVRIENQSQPSGSTPENSWSMIRCNSATSSGLAAP